MRFVTEPKGAIGKLTVFVEPAALEKFLAQHVPTGQYTIETMSDGDHKWGDGGFHETIVRLLKGDELVMLSVHYYSWGTTSDDSIDYDGLKVRQTYLLQDDPIAKQIFDAVSAQLQTPSK